jgi:hypothetical protein
MGIWIRWTEIFYAIHFETFVGSGEIEFAWFAGHYSGLLYQLQLIDEYAAISEIKFVRGN